MIVKILCGFFITFVLLALLSMVIVGVNDKMPLWSRFRKRKNLIAAGRPPPPPMVATKNMIIAMAQRKIYNLKDNATCSPKADLDNEQKHAEEEWARRMIAESCAQLDQSQPNAVFLCEVANKLCDQIEKIIDEYNVIREIAQRFLFELQKTTVKVTARSSRVSKRTFQPFYC